MNESKLSRSPTDGLEADSDVKAGSFTDIANAGGGTDLDYDEDFNCLVAEGMLS